MVTPLCVGNCPPGMVCVQRVITTPTGTEYCCECVQDPPFCEPTADKQACKPFQCPGPIPPTDICKPRCVRMTSVGTYEVLECECRGTNECHAEFQPGITPYCVGNCPPGETCIQNIIDNGDGSFDVCCDCVPLECECPGDIDGNGVLDGLDIAGFVRCVLGVPLAVDHCECVDMDGDGVYTQVDLDTFVLLMLTKAKCFDHPCCPQADLILNIGTGVADDGSLIPSGNDDDDWISLNDPNPFPPPTPRPSTVVDPHPSWQTIPGTKWITTNYFGVNGEYWYERCFCVDPRFRNPSLTLQIRGDDDSEVYFNGTFIGFGGGFSSPQPATLTVPPALFQPGQNCIRVKVINIGGAPTGFNMAGTVTVPKGKCCCPPADLNKDIRSGVYDNGGGLIPVGLDDDTWEVTVDPSGGITPRPASVINPHPAWLTIPGTQWISAAQYGPNGTYVYRYCFCLDPRFQNAILDLYLRADDFATVWLNGVQVGATPGSYAFNTPQPTHVFVTNQDLFKPCTNCIEIHVTNSHGVVTGMNVAGTITAIDGLCCDERQYSCCNPDGFCIDLPPGVEQCPPGHTPIAAPCQQPQACCFPDGRCDFVDPRCCKASGGTVLPPGVACSTGQPQACCFGSPFGSQCLTIDPNCCVFVYDGQPQGPGTFCLGDNNGNGIDDECEPAPVCEVNQATGQCSTAPCPGSGLPCVPTCALVITGSQQVLQVLSCDCRTTSTCQMTFTPAPSVPVCFGGNCPPGTTCIRTVVDHGNGTSTICCNCGVPTP
jgi:hypothetical protein